MSEQTEKPKCRMCHELLKYSKRKAYHGIKDPELGWECYRCIKNPGRVIRFRRRKRGINSAKIVLKDVKKLQYKLEKAIQIWEIKNAAPEQLQKIDELLLDSAGDISSLYHSDEKEYHFRYMI